MVKKGQRKFEPLYVIHQRNVIFIVFIGHDPLHTSIELNIGVEVAPGYNPAASAVVVWGAHLKSWVFKCIPKFFD
jgi:hypothetical protein